jgi:hypothetical protein
LAAFEGQAFALIALQHRDKFDVCWLLLLFYFPSPGQLRPKPVSPLTTEDAVTKAKRPALIAPGISEALSR